MVRRRYRPAQARVQRPFRFRDGKQPGLSQCAVRHEVPGVADEAHGVRDPEKPSPRTSCREKTTPELSWTFPRNREACEGRAVDSRQTRDCRERLLRTAPRWRVSAHAVARKRPCYQVMSNIRLRRRLPRGRRHPRGPARTPVPELRSEAPRCAPGPGDVALEGSVIFNDCYDPKRRARETSTFRNTPASFMAMVRVV